MVHMPTATELKLNWFLEPIGISSNQAIINTHEILDESEFRSELCSDGQAHKVLQCRPSAVLQILSSAADMPRLRVDIWYQSGSCLTRRYQIANGEAADSQERCETLPLVTIRLERITAH
jgi:hypothetical protein